MWPRLFGISTVTETYPDRDGIAPSGHSDNREQRSAHSARPSHRGETRVEEPTISELTVRTQSQVVRETPSRPSRPIYIGGLDRSGKTTLAAFLTSHPSISIPAVGSNMWTYFYGQFGDLARPENLDRCLQAMLRYKHVRYLDPDPLRIRREFADGPATYGRLFALFLSHFAERAGKPRWGAQTGLIERYADHLFDEYTDLRVIHMIRDPRDRYEASLSRWPEGRGRAGGAVARWRYSVKLGELNRRRHPDDYMLLRFEDLVANPVDTVQQVCEFLGEPFYPPMMEMGEAPTLRVKLGMREKPDGTLPPLSTEHVGTFRGRVPSRELAFMQMQAGALMERFGYEKIEGELTLADQLAFVGLVWPNQAARLVAWRGMEMLQQRFPRFLGRQPGPRMIVDDGESQ